MSFPGRGSRARCALLEGVGGWAAVRAEGPGPHPHTTRVWLARGLQGLLCTKPSAASLTELLLPGRPPARLHTFPDQPRPLAPPDPPPQCPQLHEKADTLKSHSSPDVPRLSAVSFSSAAAGWVQSSFCSPFFFFQDTSLGPHPAGDQCLPCFPQVPPSFTAVTRTQAF